LVSDDFASSAPKDLAQALLNIFQYLARVSDEVLRQIDWTAPPTLIDGDITVLRVLDLQVKEFAAHIRYVESARTTHLPWQVIPSFEKLVELLRPRGKVMLRPMWHYNYVTIVSNLRDLYLAELQPYELSYIPEVDVESKIIAPLGDAFHIISFPALERNNILLHSVIGHELGHLLATELVESVKKPFLAEVLDRIEQETDLELAKDGKNAGIPSRRLKRDRLTKNINDTLTYFERAAEEIVADAVGAVLFGPAAVFSIFDVAVQHEFDLEPTSDNDYYPPWRRRIREILRVADNIAPSLLKAESGLFRMASPIGLQDRAQDLQLSSDERATLVNTRISTLRDIAKDTSDESVIATNSFADIAYTALQPYLDKCVSEVRKTLGNNAFNEDQVRPTLPSLIERLDAGVTPNAEHDNPSLKFSRVGLVDVLNSAWYHKASLSVTPITPKDRELLEQVRSQRNRLTLKAIEFVNITEQYVSKPTRRKAVGPSAASHGVLTSDDIQWAMQQKSIVERLIVTPLFDPEQSIADAAIDVRLGTEFILFRKEAFHALDISASESLLSDIGRYQERVIRRIQDRFVLHPRQLVIGSTLEYVQLPTNIMAYVIGKSTWGRTGLIIATATKVDPGFRGCITLEMINEGEVPLVLFPGMPIAQLVLHRTERPTKYSGVYSCPIGPEFPRFDPLIHESAFWLPSKGNKRSRKKKSF
jgi:dCTP deaminase